MSTHVRSSISRNDKYMVHIFVAQGQVTHK